MKKAGSIVVVMLLLLTVCSCGMESPVEDLLIAVRSHGKESPVEDFEYEMDDGEVIITGYIGSDLEIYIPKEINNRPVTTIGKEAFTGYDMTHITIPDTVVTIEKYAFYDCECLETIDLPSSLKTISEGAFLYSGLKEVKLPDGLEELKKNSFAYCDNLDELKIPSNTEIEISVYTLPAGYVGTVTFFDSPVGGDNVTQYNAEYQYAQGSTEFEELNTVLIVEKDSYAYNQVYKYTGYGLTIEIE